MIISSELNYQLNFLKEELEKKENAEFKSLLEFISAFQKKDVTAIQKTFEDLQTLCSTQPKNYFAFSLLAFCYINNHNLGLSFYSTRREVQELLKKALALKNDFVFANHLLGASLACYHYCSVSTFMVQTNVEEGIKLLTIAASQGYLPAQYDLAHVKFGIRYGDNGREWLEDSNQLRQAIRIIAEAGYPAAQFEFYSGIGNKDEGDIKKRVELLEEAAACGHKEAQYELGKCYEQGIGVETDFSQAIIYFKQCEANPFVDGFRLNIATAFRLAMLFEKPGAFCDLSLSLQYYQKTHMLGSKLLETYKKILQNHPDWHSHERPQDIHVGKGGKADEMHYYCGQKLSEIMKVCEEKLNSLFLKIKTECAVLFQYHSIAVDGTFNDFMTSEISEMALPEPEASKDETSKIAGAAVKA